MDTSPNRPHVNWELLAMAGLLLLGASLRIEGIGSRSLWADEAFAVDMARMAVPDLLAFLRAHDTHPPGYYLLLHAWMRLVGHHLGWMRAPSLVCGLAAVVLVWRLGRGWFSPAVGVGAAALVALNPFQIYASNELRMYMPLEVLGLASTWLLWRARGEPHRIGWWIGYGVGVAAMAYASYYAALLVGAQTIWLLTQRPRAPLVRRMALAAAIALALFAPWLGHLRYLGAVFRADLLTIRQPLWATYLPEVFAAQTSGGYLFYNVTYHAADQLGLSLHGLLVYPFLVLVAVGVVVLGRVNRPARTLAVVALAFPVVVVVAGSLVGGGVGAYAYHINFLQPFTALLLAGGVVHLRQAAVDASPTLVALLAAVLVLLSLGPAINNLLGNPSYLSFRYDQAARLVRALYAPTDAVVYFPEGLRRGFTFYFAPPGREVGVPVTITTRARESLQDPIRRAADALGPEDARVWLVYSPIAGEAAITDLVEAIEARGYRRAIFHDFQGVRVGLLVRPVRRIPPER